MDWAIGSDVDPAGLCSYMKALDFVSTDAAGSHGRVEFRLFGLLVCRTRVVVSAVMMPLVVVHAEHG